MTLWYLNRDWSLETEVAHSGWRRPFTWNLRNAKQSIISPGGGNSCARILGARDNGKLIMVRDLPQIGIGSLTLAYVYSCRSSRDNYAHVKIPDRNFAIALWGVQRKLIEMDVGTHCYDDDIDSHCTSTWTELNFFYWLCKLQNNLQSRKCYDVTSKVGQQNSPLPGSGAKGGSIYLEINNLDRS